MKYGYPNTNWLCPESLTQISGILLRFLAIQSLHWIFEMSFITCMAAKTILVGYFNPSRDHKSTPG